MGGIPLHNQLLIVKRYFTHLYMRYIAVRPPPLHLPPFPLPPFQQHSTNLNSKKCPLRKSNDPFGVTHKIMQQVNEMVQCHMCLTEFCLYLD